MAGLHEGIQGGQKVQRGLADRVHVRGRPRQGLGPAGLGLKGRSTKKWSVTCVNINHRYQYKYGLHGYQYKIYKYSIEYQDLSISKQDTGAGNHG